MMDLLIVGGGPAGMAAAIEAHRLGLTTLIIDENPALGGQIHRSAGQSVIANPAVLGRDYHAGKALVEAVEQAQIETLTKATVWMIERTGDARLSVGISWDSASRSVTARCVLIATGALERPFPISGWILPGVMTAGAGQSLLKTSGIVPEGPLVLAGMGPLLYLLAAQYARAKVPVAAILDTTPRRNWRAALKHLPAFLACAYAWKGIRLLGEARLATRIIGGVTALQAVGDRVLKEVRVVAGRNEHRIAARTLMLHQGVVPQINLGMAAGCDYRWNDDRLAFEPVLGPCGETNQPGIFIAGDSSGVGGAEAAKTSGQLAALAVATHLGLAPVDLPRIAALRGQIAAALRGRSFLDSLYRPPLAFRVPADEVVICRCEDVTAGAIRRAAEHGAPGPNQAKAFLRAGMGICQGRLCGLTVTEVMAEAKGRSPADIGHFRLRNPVKPLTLGELASACSDHGRGAYDERDEGIFVRSEH
jgi:NADPH-dependent 2,4-dienoyl-CoA reductase/sulfur reductase-like enzyme